MTTPQAYLPDPKIEELGPDFYDVVAPAPFPQAIERFFNHRWAKRIRLGALEPEQRRAHFCRFEPLPDNLTQPLALRYHGHQFRHYNPDLGDGRGFLFAQLRDEAGRLLDLGTKGSGRTPWSRTADGRLTLKGGVREILATEMLEALGVDTSKSFALFETGEKLVRGDEPSPTRSAVLTRLGHGHIRIGSFQRLAYHDDRANIARLARYCLEHLHAEQPLPDDSDNAALLFDKVAAATARLAASYMAAGFVHGVLNSDNIAISGESFDYGPWRFAPQWDPGFTAAYFDEYGLYAFGRQPEAIHWDLAQLAGSLSLITPQQPLAEALEQWSEQFEAELIAALVKRLGVAPGDRASDRELAIGLLGALRSRLVGIDRLLFDWRGGREPASDLYRAEPFAALREALAGRRAPPRHAYWSDAEPCSMHIEEVEAIWRPIADADDWSAFEAKLAAVRRMGEAMAEIAEPAA